MTVNQQDLPLVRPGRGRASEAAIPFIISGAPRSGTSLFYNLFDGHTAISWLALEGFFFEWLYSLGESSECLLSAFTSLPTADFLTGLRDKELMPRLEVPYRQSVESGTVSRQELEIPWDESALVAVLEQGLPGVCDSAAMWGLLVAAYMAALGQPVRRYACLKSPDYAKSAISALRMDSRARAVVVLRDPLQALDSLKRSREMRGVKRLTWPVFATCLAEMRAMLDRIEAAPAGRLRTVRFEDLVAAPDTVLRDVADWLDIVFEPCLLQPTMLGQAWPGLSSFALTEGIDKRVAKRPIAALNETELAVAQRALAGYAACGYPL